VDARYTFANARAAELLAVLHAPVMGTSPEVRHKDENLYACEQINTRTRTHKNEYIYIYVYIHI